MTYNFTSQTITKNIDETIVFQTGKVVGETCTTYAAGSWRIFENPMQLLPGTRDFKFTDNPMESYVVIAGKEINIPTVLPKIPYPSPFTDKMTISVVVNEGSHYVITVIQVKWYKPHTVVLRSVDNNFDYVDGAYQVEWNSSTAPSGHYYYLVVKQDDDEVISRGQVIKN